MCGYSRASSNRCYSYKRLCVQAAEAAVAEDEVEADRLRMEVTELKRQAYLAYTTEQCRVSVELWNRVHQPIEEQRCAHIQEH